MVVAPPRFTEMHMAVSKGDEDAVKQLLRKHPEQVKQKDGTGQTPLHIAASLGHLPLSKLLLAAYPGAATIKSDTGWTPGDQAKKYKRGWVASGWQAVVGLLEPFEPAEGPTTPSKSCDQCGAKLCTCLGAPRFCSRCGAPLAGRLSFCAPPEFAPAPGDV